MKRKPTSILVTTIDGHRIPLETDNYLGARPTRQGGVIDLRQGGYLLVSTEEFRRVTQEIAKAKGVA